VSVVELSLGELSSAESVPTSRPASAESGGNVLSMVESEPASGPCPCGARRPTKPVLKWVTCADALDAARVVWRRS
jgi:hypothetical protein